MQRPTEEPSASDVPEISVTELSTSLERGEELVLVDVREPFERRIADLPEVGQLRIPMGELEGRVEELDREDTIVLYCRSGARSGRATQLLRDRGFTGALNLAGGLLAWRDEIDSTMRAY